MKRFLLLLCPGFLCLGVVYLHFKNGVTRFDLPKGELKWSNTRPQNARMCIPAAFTDEQGQILGLIKQPMVGKILKIFKSSNTVAQNQLKPA